MVKKKMKNLLKEIDNRLNDFEGSKYGKLKIYIGLLIFFALLHLPNVFVIRSFSGAAFPLNSFNPNLVATVISPSNNILLIPPGIHFLAYILGNVRNIFLFLFMVQLVVPILSYKLFRSVSSSLVSLLISSFFTYYFISTDWWCSDYLIQPLIMIGLLILLIRVEKFEINDGHKLLCLGLITGIVVVLKHNEGIFWGVLVLSFFLFCSIVFSGDSHYTKKRPLLFIIFIGFFTFGFLFLTRQIHVDAIVYYLFPYFMFWGMITYYIIKNKSIGFDSVIFLKNTFLFSIAALILPCIVFLWMGSMVGYTRYLSSFGMGLQYLPLWDFGIAGVIGNYAKFQGVHTFKNIFLNYQSVIFLLLFLLPFVVNCLVNIGLFHLIHNKTTTDANLKNFFKITSMSILGIFMFFPLEGYHILSTKLFIFSFVFLYLYRCFSSEFSESDLQSEIRKQAKTDRILNPKRSKNLSGKRNYGIVSLKLVLIVIIIPIIMYSVYQPIVVSRITTSYGSEQVERAIGIPMEKSLADELNKQAGIVKRVTQGSSYYVIDSSGATLMTLMTIENNHYPQFYLEMRKGILNQEVTYAIIFSLQQTPFVLVNYNDYQKYLSGQQDDPFMAQILDFVHNNYVIVDRYEEPSTHISHLLSFLIMEKKST